MTEEPRREPGVVRLSRSDRKIVVLHGEDGGPPVVRVWLTDRHGGLDGEVLELTPEEADDVAHRLTLCAIYARRRLAPEPPP